MSLSKCALRSPIGKFCIVRVEVRGNRMFFGDGWPDFVKDNYLEIGDFLVFEYDDKSTFNVKIYGRNGCEKDVRVAKKNSDNPISLEKKEEQVQEKESFGKKAIKSNKINCEYNMSSKEPIIVNDDEEELAIENSEIFTTSTPKHSRSTTTCPPTEAQIDMDNEVIKDDDDINLESFGDELDALPRFRDKNNPIQFEDEEDENEDDDNDASGGTFGSHDDIDFNFLHNK
nr:putative b3 domain-containing protein [Quercus suber]